MAQRQSLTLAQRINSVKNLRSSKSYRSGMAHYTMLVQLAMYSGHISIKFADVEL